MRMTQKVQIGIGYVSSYASKYPQISTVSCVYIIYVYIYIYIYITAEYMPRWCILTNGLIDFPVHHQPRIISMEKQLKSIADKITTEVSILQQQDDQHYVALPVKYLWHIGTHKIRSKIDKCVIQIDFIPQSLLSYDFHTIDSPRLISSRGCSSLFVRTFWYRWA